jgi:uncharacterized protein YkwD
MRPMSRGPQRLAHPSLLLAAAFLALLALAVGPAAHPAPASASTATTMEAQIVSWINSARQNRGVPALRVGSKLTDLAGSRATTLARTTVLVHPSCLGCMYNNWDISWSACGEAIAMTTYPWGYQAARSIFLGWKNSPGHWSLLMSRSYKRIGIGVAYRSSNHSTWSSADLAG